MLAPENNEDAGEKGEDSWNKAEVESKYCNQANENQINREQQHSDIFVKGHDSSMEQGAWSVEWEPPPCSVLPAPCCLLQPHQFANVFHWRAAKGNDCVVVVFEIEGCGISGFGTITQIKMLGHAYEVGR
jgi:hypothetical protein